MPFLEMIKKKKVILGLVNKFPLWQYFINSDIFINDKFQHD